MAVVDWFWNLHFPGLDTLIVSPSAQTQTYYANSIFLLIANCAVYLEK